MPTERFLNLPAEKRERVLRAAVEEMARVPFSEVSINRIIQAAGIARGSFYQYFEDKNDLLEHIMAGYQADIEAAARKSLAATGGNIFTAVQDVLGFVVAFGTKPENYDFCRNVFSSAMPCAEERFAFLKMNAQTMARQFTASVDVSGLRDGSEENLVLLMKVLSALMRDTLLRVLKYPEKKDQLRADFEAELDVVRYGVLKKEGL
ncbi:TetR/AcrR family transcriptional regulator [Ruminococcaceae bacterium OttesenSCG-928-D13]|nr:TetR/AcrR family transcriptional regulator [Ruminococcaceae bacterium OttesenSCG-928-D13]